ncbi:MAG: helix-turn-helix transcriptional regulator [Clostridia bacterium]|nr:helix-turn-helix transcriptional regulator [Clostridia bacterium]
MLKLNVLNLLEKKGKSKYWLFNQLNQLGSISYTNFNNIVMNKTNSIKYENIEKFCQILECEPNDLFIKTEND